MNFEYTQVSIPKDGIFKISPSQIDKFFSYPTIWYRENFLGEKDFIANTATVLGTIVHGIAESSALNENLSPEEIHEKVETYIMETANKLPLGETLDIKLIKQLYPVLAPLLINEYVAKNPPTEVEAQLCALVKDGVYVAGSCDNMTNGTIVDYKNVTTKPKTDSIPFNYKIQLLAYAFAYRARGEEIDRIRLVYTVRPTKTLPARIFEVNEVISDDDWKLIEDTLELIADTVVLVKKQPELAYLLFKSMKLKEK